MARRDECVSCLSPQLKATLKEFTHPKFHAEIDEFPTCGPGLVLQLCPYTPTEAPARRRKTGGEKRPRSQYQEFISTCMKQQPLKGKPFGEAAKYMKECASKWRQQKNGSK